MVELSKQITTVTVKDYAGVDVTRKLVKAFLDGVELPHSWWFPTATTDVDAWANVKDPTTPGGLSDKGYAWDTEAPL